MRRGFARTWALVVGVLCGRVAADDRIVGSPHDLSATGPGRIHALEEEQVCIFCHAPHNATGQRALWNRFDHAVHYRIYASSTTDARIDQPGGPSKMCLSCHDGAMALGLVASSPDPGPIAMTARTIPPGSTDLTEDLSDDHPIGFRYDRALANRDPQIKNPDRLSVELPLGAHGEMHCTTCHDPHNNQLGDFLREPMARSTLCLSCHELFGWHESSHATSAARADGRAVDPREPMPYHTVAENACTSCHKIHSAGSRDRLLRFRRDEDNCLNCHSGGVARTNVANDFRKRSTHPVDRAPDVHDPKEDPRRLRRHVTCADCHNPHAVAPSARTVADTLHATFDAAPRSVDTTTRYVAGMDRSGQPTRNARFEYEICLKCHADGQRAPAPSRIVRQVIQGNTRLEFQTSNPSFHPVFGPRRNSDVVSLLAPLRVGSVIACTDCHNSDSADRVGLDAVSGPHGSIFEPLLIANYNTGSFAAESPQAYALCYRCHDRRSILADESFPLHDLHVSRERTPCSVCHDAHGVSRTQGNDTTHSHLINFDRSVVQPVPGGSSAGLRFTDLGSRRGSCTLTCHGVAHVDFEYGR